MRSHRSYKQATAGKYNVESEVESYGNRESKINGAAGELIMNYTYDYDNRLIRADFPDGTNVQYIYDVFGMIPAPSEEDGEDVYKRYEVIVSGKSKGIKDNKWI